MAPRDMISSLRNGEIDGVAVGEPEGNRSISLNVGWMAVISPNIWKDYIDHVFHPKHNDGYGYGHGASDHGETGITRRWIFY